MHSGWQLQEAKSNLSHLIKRAAGGDAQVSPYTANRRRCWFQSKNTSGSPAAGGKLSAALLRPDFVAKDLDFPRSRDTGRDK